MLNWYSFHQSSNDERQRQPYWNVNSEHKTRRNVARYLVWHANDSGHHLNNNGDNYNTNDKNRNCYNNHKHINKKR